MKKGFSLPIWVAGAAKSAVKKLVGLSSENYELIKIPKQKKHIKIPVHAASLIFGSSHALGISFAKSGLDLDITQNLEIWTIVSLEKNLPNNIKPTNKIKIIAGHGVGIYKTTKDICISKFAREVLFENLLDFIPEDFILNLEITFPKGKFLAERTSNKSFGIVEGLSIIGTSSETYSSASENQLKKAKEEIKQLVSRRDFQGKIVFVIGENGLNLAKSCNLQFPIIKVGNWIGPLLVYAALENVKTVILFGYHGKLIKLAGGIFHTHNHLADARIEILVYLAVLENIPFEIIQQLSNTKTIDEALLFLEGFSKSKADQLWNKLIDTIEERSLKYVNKYTNTEMEIAAVIFDKQRQVRWFGFNGKNYISSFKEN